MKKLNVKLAVGAFVALFLVCLGKAYNIQVAVEIFNAFGNAVFGVFGLYIAWRIIKPHLRF